MPINIFVQFLAGPRDVRESSFGVLLKVIAWTTLVVGPILLFLLLQIQFLPYHHSGIIWTHRITLVADLMLVWWLWRAILSGRGDFRRWRSWTRWATPALGIVLSLAAVLFSWTIATFPGEWQEEHLPSFAIVPTKWFGPEWVPADEPFKSRIPGEWISLHTWIFDGDVDLTTRRRVSLFSNTLVLPGFNIYDAFKIDDPKKVEWKDRLIDLRKRDLKGAAFDGAILVKADLYGAQLQHASLFSAQLTETSLGEAQLVGASLRGAQLQGSWLNQANLRNTVLIGAQLQGASLVLADIQEADLSAAQLQGASFERAELQHASFEDAQLQGALLDEAHLEGASFWQAQLKGVSLKFAELEDTSFENAQFQDLSLDGAHLHGAPLENAGIDEAAYKKALAGVLGGLVCSGETNAIYALRGLLNNSRIEATGVEGSALVTRIMSKDCRVSAALTEADKTRLRAVVKHIAPPPAAKK